MRAGVEASVLLLAFLPFVFLVTLQLLAPALLTPLRSPFGEFLFGLAVAWMVAGLPPAPEDVGAATRGAGTAPGVDRVTPTLLAGLALAAVCGISVAACYLALPRRLTAEEWILHRRALAAAAEPRASRPVAGGVAWRPRWLASDQYRAVADATARDLQLLRLAGQSAPATSEVMAETIGSSAAAGAAIWSLHSARHLASRGKAGPALAGASRGRSRGPGSAGAGLGATPLPRWTGSPEPSTGGYRAS